MYTVKTLIIFILGFPSGEDVMWTISQWNTPIANHESHELFRKLYKHIISVYRHKETKSAIMTSTFKTENPVRITKIHIKVNVEIKEI